MVERCKRKAERFKAESRNEEAETPKKYLRGRPGSGSRKPESGNGKRSKNMSANYAN